MTPIAIGFIINGPRRGYMVLFTPFSWNRWWLKRSDVPLEVVSCCFGPLFISVNAHYTGEIK